MRQRLSHQLRHIATSLGGWVWIKSFLQILKPSFRWLSFLVAKMARNHHLHLFLCWSCYCILKQLTAFQWWLEGPPPPLDTPPTDFFQMLDWCASVLAISCATLQPPLTLSRCSLAVPHLLQIFAVFGGLLTSCTLTNLCAKCHPQ